MNVVQINSVYKYGSTGNIVSGIHKKLNLGGYDSHVIYGRHKRVGSKNVLFIGSRIGLMVHGFFTRLLDAHSRFSFLATKKLIRYLRRVKPDIVHVHNIHGYYLNFEMLFDFLSKSNIPVIITLHDCWLFTGHCTHYTFVGCEKWKKECNNCPLKREYPKTYIDNSRINFNLKLKTFKKLKKLTLVSPSNWLKKEVSKSFLKNYESVVINNGIDLSKFAPSHVKKSEKMTQQNKYIILGVANKWTEAKGFRIFLEFYKLLRDDEQIILVGLTTSQLSQIPAGIHGILRVNSMEELSRIYGKSNVFINPTLEDTFPTTNIEALASGVPVITFPTGGSPEIIDENTGLVTVGKSAFDIRQSLDILRSGKTNINSASCRKRASELFDKDNRHGDYIKLYEKIYKRELNCKDWVK